MGQGRGHRFLILVVFLVAAMAVAFPLFKTPILGIANNGDFGKVCLQFALSAPQEEEYLYVSRIYRFDESKRWDSGFRSTEALLVRVAQVVDDWLYVAGPDLDIRSMGIVHGVPFLVGLGLLVAFVTRVGGWRAWLLGGAGFFFLADFMYISYWNSFSMDAVALSFGILSAGLTVWILLRPSWMLAILLTISLCALVGSKTQHAVFLLPLAIWILSCGKNWWPRGGKWVRVMAALAVIASGVVSFRATSQGYAALSTYDIVFHRIVPWSANQDAALTELGLDSSYRRYAGTHAFAPGAPTMDLDWVLAFEQKVSSAKVAGYLLRHPVLTFRMLIDGLDAAGLQRAHNIGNFEKQAGFVGESLSSHFSFWNRAKTRIFKNHGLLYLSYFVLLAMALLWLLRNHAAAPAGWLLIVLAALAMGVGCLGDSVEVTRHLLLFDALLDGILWTVLVLATKRSSVARMNQ